MVDCHDGDSHDNRPRAAVSTGDSVGDSVGDASVVAGDGPIATPRRDFIATTAMIGGLAAGYGAMVAMAGRYLYIDPTAETNKAWQYVVDVKSIAIGDAIDFISPTGMKIVIARQATDGTDADFIALSSVCPHLGCQVHWQPHKNRFFCPCHNGVFDPQGKATAGPPAAAGQSLAEYPLRIEDGLLFIEVPLVGLNSPEVA